MDADITNLRDRVTAIETRFGFISEKLVEIKSETKESFKELKDLLQASNLSNAQLRDDINILYNQNVIRDSKIDAHAITIKEIKADIAEFKKEFSNESKLISNTKAVVLSGGTVLKWLGASGVAGIIFIILQNIRS